MKSTRRSVLRLSGIVLGSSIAGCSAPSLSPNLTFSAEMVRQQSDEAPARVSATLTNAGSSTVEIGFGPTLLFTDNTAADDLEWADSLVIDPETYIGPWSDPVRTEDGCWRYPAEAWRAIQSILEYRELEPQQSIEETYDIYTAANASSCLPNGSYRFQDKGVIGNDSQSVTLTLVLHVDDDQEISATTETPTITEE